MGKKHKKESKKRKHHSRSRSRSKSTDREIEKEKRKHHKKHHKEKKREKAIKKPKSEISSNSDDDVEYVPPPAPKISVGSPSPPPPPKISREISHETSPPTKSEGDNLSIAETNALRAKLGLKPLQVETKPVVPKPDATTNGTAQPKLEGGVDMGEFVHKPAENLTNKKMTEKLKQKLTERKEKRKFEKKLLAVKTLGDASEDELADASSWVKKNRKIENERIQAQKKAKELDEMDAEFGLEELVKEELKKEKNQAYTTKDLKNLTVEHDIDNFTEGRQVILTLKDKGVLDEEDDSLVNVNLLDEERYKKNILNRKKKPYGYDAADMDDMDIEDEEKNVLSKYDEEIEGEKKNKFKLGEVNQIKRETVKEKLKARAKMTLESLELPALKVASDYLTENEMKAKFKKPKKMKKVRKRALKADDLLALAASGNDSGSGLAKTEPGIKDEPMDTDFLDIDDTPQQPILDDEVVKLEPPEEDTELELALRKARRLKQLELRNQSARQIGELIKQENEPSGDAYQNDDPGPSGGNIILNSTAEFCRTLGDIPTYGLSGNRDEEAQELLDFEKDVSKSVKKTEEPVDRGGWNDAEMDDKLVDIQQVEAPILDAEPDLGAGVAGALRLAMSKGYLEKETTNRPSAARFSHLQAQNYSIEDKAHGDDEKFGRRERYMGPTSDFKEKDGYKPNIKLEYIDDEGHLLSAKEAFRYLSHKFHGKGPGKNKVEKRMKKSEQQVLMKQMSSTDTPLGTLQMLQQKQKETQSPFVVLSGSKQLGAATSISKAKLTK